MSMTFRITYEWANMLKEKLYIKTSSNEIIGIMEIGRKEKYRKGKMSKIKISKAIDVSDGADVRIRPHSH